MTAKTTIAGSMTEGHGRDGASSRGPSSVSVQTSGCLRQAAVRSNCVIHDYRVVFTPTASRAYARPVSALGLPRSRSVDRAPIICGRQ